MVSFNSSTSPARLDGDLLARSPFATAVVTVGDVAHLVGEVVGHCVDVVGQVLPGAGHALHVRLAAEAALGADLAGDARDLVRERGELVDHRVDRVLQLENLAADVNGDLPREIAVRTPLS
jgi:hypothetical protein